MQPPIIEEINPAYTFIAIIFLVGMMLAAIQILNIRRKQARTKTITEIECPKCSYKARREFRRGDYIGKKTKCPSCGGEAEITRIYIEPTGKEKT